MPLPTHCDDHDRPNCRRCEDSRTDVYGDPGEYQTMPVHNGVRVHMSDDALIALLTFYVEQDDDLREAVMTVAKSALDATEIESDADIEAIGPGIFMVPVVAAEPGAADAEDYMAVDAARMADEARALNSERRQA